MKNKFVKHIALCAAVLIVVACSAVLYMWLPQKKYSPAVNDRYALHESTSESAAVVQEQEDEASVEQAQLSTAEAEDAVHERALNDGLQIKTSTSGSDLDTDLSIIEKMQELERKIYESEDRAEQEELLLELSALVRKEEITIARYWETHSYKPNFRKIEGLIADRGYSADELDQATLVHTQYWLDEQFMVDINKAEKARMIDSLADNNEPDIFMKHIEELFPDKKNIGYLFIKQSYYWGLRKMPELFNTYEETIYALDDFESEIIDKRVLLSWVYDHAKASSNMRITEPRELDNVGLGCFPFLVILELDGKL